MKSSFETLRILLLEKLSEKGFDSDLKYQKRLRYELIEVETQGYSDYFLDLYKNKIKKNNENNLLIPYLLDICDDINIDEMCKTKTNEFPDVDIDFLAPVRDYLKNDFTIKHYNSQKTCSIGTYGRYALKSALLDMARIYGLDRSEALYITTQLRLRDEDGEMMTFEESVENFPELETYLKQYPQVSIAIQKLMHRIRSTGKHAGGVIICNDDINKFVPLMKTTGGENLVSQYVEGLATQELGPIGLVKFDLLVVSALEQLANAAKLIKQRHDIKVIAGSHEDWDNTDYLNDVECIKTADRADLLGIFQYDSPGIRDVVKKAGINSFDDLVAIVSLYRPGPLNMKMDELFIKRKRGLEKYENHPLLEPILGSTYGILIYQEQVMKILNVVGKIPLKDCESIRKAISKKKISSFIKYKEMFIENGMSLLGKTREEVAKLFELIEAFSAYGFNLSHATAYTFTSSRQLYLKTYYPLEFYTALLMLETDEAKIRIYLSDAERHGIEIMSLDLNKSKENFSIQDGKIYIGFGNIKGIGADRAKEIVKLQPFEGFEDFLTRFGTDANVLRALIPLKIFKEDHPEILYKFWMYFNIFSKKDHERDKRFMKNIQNLKNQMTEKLPEKYSKLNLDDEEQYESFIKIMKDNKEIMQIHNKIIKCKNNYESKDIQMPMLVDFESDSVRIEDKEIIKECNDLVVAENKYFGFQFTSNLKNCKTFDRSLTFQNVCDVYEKEKHAVRVQVEVMDASVKKSKSGSKYCQLVCIDSEFSQQRLNVFEDDYSIFKNLLQKGNLLSILCRPPSNGFSTFSLFSPPKYLRHKLPQDPNQDFRIVDIK